MRSAKHTRYPAFVTFLLSIFQLIVSSLFGEEGGGRAKRGGAKSSRAKPVAKRKAAKRGTAAEVISKAVRGHGDGPILHLASARTKKPRGRTRRGGRR